MSDAPRSPELEHLFELYGEVLKAQLRVSLPGRITEYDKTKQRASVKALVKDSYVNALQKRVADSIPEIHGAPVMMPGPPRGRITFPVKVGDLCLIQFCSSAITQWVLKGGEVDPKNDRHLDINDAIAIVGLHHFADVPTDAPDDAVVVNAGLGITIKLGSSSAVLPVTRTTDVQTALVLALTDPDILDPMYTYMSTPAGPAKAAALVALVAAVNAHFVAEPVEGAEKVTAE